MSSEDLPGRRRCPDLLAAVLALAVVLALVVVAVLDRLAA